MSVRFVAWLSFCCQYPISPDRAAGAHSGLALDSVATTPPTVPATAMTRPAPIRRVFREIFILIPLPGVRLSPPHVQPRLVPCARAGRHLASPAPCARTRLYAPGRRPTRAYRTRNRRVRTQTHARNVTLQGCRLACQTVVAWQLVGFGSDMPNLADGFDSKDDPVPGVSAGPAGSRVLPRARSDGPGRRCPAACL